MGVAAGLGQAEETMTARALSADTVLCILCRQPVPGRTKTRLIPALGATAAAQLSAVFLIDLLGRCARELPATFRILLCHDSPSPLDGETWFQALIREHASSRSIALQAQASGDLGARLAAVRASMDGPLIFIGSDAPDLPLAEMQHARAHACAGRAYIVRAHDGGYALLALPRQAGACVFDDIDWSTVHTGRQQIERIMASGLETVDSAQQWWDVDEPADLAPLRERLEAQPQLAPLTLSFLRTLPLSGFGVPR